MSDYRTSDTQTAIPTTYMICSAFRWPSMAHLHYRPCAEKRGIHHLMRGSLGRLQEKGGRRIRKRPDQIDIDHTQIGKHRREAEPGCCACTVALPIKATLVNSPSERLCNADTSIVEMTAFALLLLPLDLFALTYASRSKSQVGGLL